MLMLALALALWMAADPLDFDFFVQRVEPIFLKAREGAARCYNCHSLEATKRFFISSRLGRMEPGAGSNPIASAGAVGQRRESGRKVTS